MMSKRIHTAALASALTVAAAGCTSFSTLRSAEVYSGPSMTLQASVSTPPGPETGWFWSFDCPEACDHPVVGADLGFTYGSTAGFAGRPVALGLGIILLSIVLALNAGANVVKETAQRRYG